MFTGMSALRALEKKEEAPKNSALQDYLQKRYGGGGADDEDVKKRKKKKPKPSLAGACQLLDHDVSGFKQPSSEKAPAGEGEIDEEVPTVANIEQARAFVHQIKQAKRHYEKREDGSGWEQVQADSSGRGQHGAAATQRQRHNSPDASPPRRRPRHDSPDASPPRRRQRHDSPDASPPRRRQRHDSPDASPPRRQQRHDTPDASPPRRQQRHDTPDASPPRRHQRHDTPDASPPRRQQRHDTPDASPPRRGQPPGSQAPPARMADGTVAGLVDAAALAKEAAALREAAERRRAGAQGRGAATVYRDKVSGKVISADEYAAAKALERKKGRKAPAEEVEIAWRGGMAQQRSAAAAAQAAAEEAAKDFHRSFDNDADAIQRQQHRWGDPMAGKLRGSKAGGDLMLPPPIITEANRLAMEASGFIVPQEVPAHSWLRRGIGAPLNRYGIRPGRHWDGVDRSCGFEKNLFRQQNERAARDMEARMWSQADM